MDEFLVIYLVIYGAFAAAAPYADQAGKELRNFSNDAEKIGSRLPGIENLHEKSLPVSHLYTDDSEQLPGTKNLEERSQIRRELPGTRNLAEKAIPDSVIQRMAKNQAVSGQGQPEDSHLQSSNANHEESHEF